MDVWKTQQQTVTLSFRTTITISDYILPPPTKTDHLYLTHRHIVCAFTDQVSKPRLNSRVIQYMYSIYNNVYTVCS